MTIRFSDALRTHLAGSGSLAKALTGGFVRFFSGSQPATPVASIPAGNSPLLDITLGGNSHTAGVQGAAAISTAGMANGTVVNSITLAGAGVSIPSVTLGSDPAANAVLLANAINSGNDARITALASGNSVVVSEARGYIGKLNGANVVVASVSASFGASNAPANGLTWALDGTAGELAKLAAEAWQGTAGAAGSAGWFRVYGPLGANDPMFVDGSVGTAGTDLVMLPTTSIVSGSTNTLPSASLTL